MLQRYCLLFFLSYLATVHFWPLYFNMDDEAVTTLGATRILAGEWPYKDWSTRHTPGSQILTALWFLLFGSGQVATRSLFSLLAALIGVLIHASAERLLPEQGKFRYLPWFLWTTTGVFDTPHLNYHWFGVLGSTATLYCSLIWAQTGKATRAAGASAAFALWCLQSNGLAAVLNLALVWLRLRPPGLLKVLAGFAVASLVLWLPFLPFASQVAQESLFALPRHLEFAIYPYSWDRLTELARDFAGLTLNGQFTHWVAAWSYWALTALRFGLFYIVIGLALVVCEWRRDRRSLPLMWAGLAWALASGPRQQVGYVAFCSPAWYLAFAVLCVHLRAKPLVWAWVAFELIAYPCRWLSSHQAHVHPIATRQGVYWSANAAEARDMNEVHEWIQRFCPPDSYILGYEYFARIYTLHRLRNPIRNPVLISWLSSEWEYEECVRRLRALQVPYILLRPVSGSSIADIATRVVPAQFDREFARHWELVKTDYELVAENASCSLWRRRK